MLEIAAGKQRVQDFPASGDIEEEKGELDDLQSHLSKLEAKLGRAQYEYKSAVTLLHLLAAAIQAEREDVEKAVLNQTGCSAEDWSPAAKTLDHPVSKEAPAGAGDQPIIDVVVEFFKNDGWHFSQVGEEPLLRLDVSGEHGEWTCFAQAREEKKQFIFYSVCPVPVPEDKRVAVAEFLTRANYGLVIGNFEMNFQNGNVEFRTSIDVEGDRLSPALVRNLVYANIATMGRYLPGIMALIHYDLSPSEAIARVEGQGWPFLANTCDSD
ncbi:MAG: YbjN domain-containing protein [Firmicutes bacterium]|nr:YbjN domain-containing protein [Bacillota bacterium]